MILRRPDYFEEFHCIADKCKHCCCVGDWQVDIDDDTYEYYKGLENDLAKTILESITETEDGQCIDLGKKGRCPMLDENGLCQICIKLGEEHISEVCNEYPRFMLYYGNKLFKSLSMSCEEVARIIFSKDDIIGILESQVDIKEEDNADYQNIDEDWMGFMESLFENIYKLLTDRKRPLDYRMKMAIVYCKLAEKAWDNEQTDDFGISSNLWEDCLNDSINFLKNAKTMADADEAYRIFSERFIAFREMDILDKDWLSLIERFDDEKLSVNYGMIIKEYKESDCYKESHYEQIMTYFIFRYLMYAMFDENPLTHVMVAFVSTMVIRDMDAIRFYDNGGKLSLNDMIENARVFSREVEHSTYNLDCLKDAFLFDDVFKQENLLKF